jgi:hypothetical protein
MSLPRNIFRPSGAEVRAARARRHAADVAPVIQSIRAAGISTIRGITEELNRRGIPTATRQGQWQASQVLKVLRRLKLAAGGECGRGV